MNEGGLGRLIYRYWMWTVLALRMWDMQLYNVIRE